MPLSSVMRDGTFYWHTDTAETHLVKSGPGVLVRLVIGDPGVSGAVTIYDSLTASGTVIAVVDVPGADNFPFYLDFGCSFNNGLTVVTSAAMDITVLYF